MFENVSFKGIVEILMFSASYQNNVNLYGFVFVLHWPFILSTDVFVLPVPVFALI